MNKENQVKNVHYFPGHMKKAQDSLAGFFKAVDLVVEVSDARSPESTRNPALSDFIGGKPHILVLSKEDKANPSVTAEWLDFYRRQGLSAFSSDLKKDKVLATLQRASEPLVAPKRLKEKKLGMRKQPLRLAIVGIPNVGKSTLINNLAGKNVVKAANTPGVTRAEQWVRLSSDFLLLDTPGILPMNYPDASQAIRLALLGSIKEEVLPNDELSLALFGYLKREYPHCLAERYSLIDISGLDSEVVFSWIAQRRGYLLPGGLADVSKASLSLIKDFQEGYLGLVSLERP